MIKIQNLKIKMQNDNLKFQNYSDQRRNTKIFHFDFCILNLYRITLF